MRHKTWFRSVLTIFTVLARTHKGYAGHVGNCYVAQLLASTALLFCIFLFGSQFDDMPQTQHRNETISALGLLGEVWLRFPDVVNTRLRCGRRLLKELTLAARSSFFTVQVSALAQLFRLLSEFANTNNECVGRHVGMKISHDTSHSALHCRFAPLIYKTLVFLIIESSYNKPIHSFLLTNMRKVIVQLPMIPVSFQSSMCGHTLVCLHPITLVAQCPRWTHS